MSIISEIDRIIAARNNIVSAIEDKGVAVPSDSCIDDLPGLIQKISTSSGSTLETVTVAVTYGYLEAYGYLPAYLSYTEVADYVFTQNKTDTRTEITIVAQGYKNNVFVKNIISTIITTKTGRVQGSFTYDGTYDCVVFGVSGAITDNKIKLITDTLSVGEKYVISADFINVTQGSVSWKDVQLELGTTATDYEPYTDSSGKNLVKSFLVFANVIIEKDVAILTEKWVTWDTDSTTSYTLSNVLKGSYVQIVTFAGDGMYDYELETADNVIKNDTDYLSDEMKTKFQNMADTYPDAAADNVGVLDDAILEPWWSLSLYACEDCEIKPIDGNVQTPLKITENGTYDVSDYKEVTVAVPTYVPETVTVTVQCGYLNGYGHVPTLLHYTKVENGTSKVTTEWRTWDTDGSYDMVVSNVLKGSCVRIISCFDETGTVELLEDTDKVVENRMGTLGEVTMPTDTYPDDADCTLEEAMTLNWWSLSIFAYESCNLDVGSVN